MDHNKIQNTIQDVGSYITLSPPIVAYALNCGMEIIGYVRPTWMIVE